jgi:hypothetical protein
MRRMVPPTPPVAQGRHRFGIAVIRLLISAKKPLPAQPALSLTTAASIWVTAALGVLCGLAAWKPLVVSVAGVRLLLLAGGSIEQWCQTALGTEEKIDPPDSR